MKKILIYGDSNVWGDNFNSKYRINSSKQWPNILKKKLGKSYQIIQEGLPARIAGDYDIEKQYKNGKNSFLPIYMTSSPVDILIIALGTNDLKLKYGRTSGEIIEDLKWYKEAVEKLYIEKPNKMFKNKFPKIYYLMPINFEYLEDYYNDSCEVKRQEIIKYFKNSNDYFSIIPNNTTLSDGLHLDYAGHEYIANLVYERIKEDNK